MIKYICPLVVVEDIQKSRNLYESVLGQTVKTDFGENISFHGDFALHQRSHFQTLIDEKPIVSKSHHFELYFETDDVTQLVNTLTQHDIEFVHEMREQPWRQYVVRFYDYDGNLIEVGERMEHVAYRLHQEHVSIERICEITYLPEDVVKQSIEEYSSR